MVCRFIRSHSSWRVSLLCSAFLCCMCSSAIKVDARPYTKHYFQSPPISATALVNLASPHLCTLQTKDHVKLALHYNQSCSQPHSTGARRSLVINQHNMAQQVSGWASYYFGDYARHSIALLSTFLLVMAGCSLHGEQYPVVHCSNTCYKSDCVICTKMNQTTAMY